MTDKPLSDSRPQMGRPPLKKDVKTRLTMVRLTQDVLDRIDALVDDQRRAEFIREAIERELERREKQKPAD